uniref:Methyltransferase FkbM domain-containing protein n=1 Tax=Haptolina brevifila TaxID=156173 RepID=A0A7S2FL84_9EUKA|mmetsp:Transcript_14731/g.29557  ORF Transcript_14731/g.29557 Transcript_14731/m.29557 type:complete len:373 (+) Transcript_14731:101-1219(+)
MGQSESTLHHHSRHTVTSTDGRLRSRSWYTPVEHPLVRHLSNRTASHHMAKRHGWPLDYGGDVSKLDHFTRRFPVEARYWLSPRSVAPCLTHAYQLPPLAFARKVGGVCEPKFACGPAAELGHSRSGCVVWSIGSAGETCFEEYVHTAAPSCSIDVFDPMLTAATRRRLESLSARGVLRLHEVGLADERTVNGSSLLKQYNKPITGDAAVRFHRCSVLQAVTAPLGPREAEWYKRNCPKARMLSLAEMFDACKVEWVDYLKIDCEGCEFTALSQFLREATRRWGHVPVTQLQVELHVSPRHTHNMSLTRRLVHSCTTTRGAAPLRAPLDNGALSLSNDPGSRLLSGAGSTPAPGRRSPGPHHNAQPQSTYPK